MVDTIKELYEATGERSRHTAFLDYPDQACYNDATIDRHVVPYCPLPIEQICNGDTHGVRNHPFYS